MKSTIFVFALAMLIACGNSGTSSGPLANLDGFEKIDAGNGTKQVIKKDGDGNLLESGFTYNGSKTGAWLTYFTGKDAGRMKTMASYTSGILNGPYFEFNNRGQIESESNYVDNKYHGKVISYKFGRPLIVKTYSRGELNGLSTDYYSDGVVQKETNFKNGKQDGSMKWYNEDGKMTMQYEYKNGEKVSGGIINE